MTIDAARRSLMIGGVLTLAGGAALAMRPRRLAVDGATLHLDALIPRNIGPWHYRDDAGLILPQNEEQDRLYDALLTRSYVAPASEIMLLIAHGRAVSASMTVHRPEHCYASNGFAVDGLRDVDWPLSRGVAVPGRFMTATRPDRVEQVGYWRRVADGFPPRYDALVVLEANLRGWIPEGVLVRVSTVNTDPASGRAAIATFMQAMVAALPRAARHLLLGPLSAALAT